MVSQSRIFLFRMNNEAKLVFPSDVNRVETNQILISNKFKGKHSQNINGGAHNSLV